MTEATLRNFKNGTGYKVWLKEMAKHDEPVQRSLAELEEENAKLRLMASRYWILRDTINWHVVNRKRIPSMIKDIFAAQMAEINAEMDQ